jgi:hypothetical protein
MSVRCGDGSGAKGTSVRIPARIEFTDCGAFARSADVILQLVNSARAGIHARPLHEARGHQPSLCYVLTALATLTDDVRDAQELCRPNPHYLHCWPGYPFQAQGAAAGHGRRLHGYMDHPGRQRAGGDLDRAVLSLAGASPYLSSGLGAAASCVPIHFATMPFKWGSRVYVTRDYTVPVDVCREDGDIAAQGDSQPIHNRLATSLWSESDMVRDEHVIQSSRVRRRHDTPTPLPAGTSTPAQWDGCQTSSVTNVCRMPQLWSDASLSGQARKMRRMRSIGRWSRRERLLAVWLVRMGSDSLPHLCQPRALRLIRTLCSTRRYTCPG